MDPLRWARVEELCAAALDRDPAARAEWLAAACGDDSGLRREVSELLEQLERDPSFLETPPAARAGPDPGLPAAIGPWRVIRRLGRGGMGEVYLADRDTEDIHQQVALKVIRLGMDTAEVLERFRLERRILASLHHPNIAALLDAAATADGRPYFVMEYVEGRPVTDYCDAERLPIAARIRLFQTIAGAVQYAHQNLVVHRDIKPGNILVTRDGVAKLLDFGIGKVLAPGEALGPGVETATNARLLTPEFAAPEQIAGGPVTTATDVHGLGLLLYRLLTGRHPYLTGRESLPEIERAILGTAPTRPSDAVDRPESRELRRRLSGDLDNIILKALRKEPERRYPSPAAMVEDLDRHLAGFPVAARPDTLGYRVRKFVRRNAALVIGVAAVFVALVATTAVTLVQSRRVALESARAKAERDKAVEVRGFLMEMFGASGANQAVGDTVTARRLLDLQAARVDEAYPGRPDLTAEMLEVLADGYDRLGLVRAAEPLARRSLELRRTALGPSHPDVAASLSQVGWIAHENGRSRDAEPLLREAIALRRAAGATAELELARSLNDLGVVYNASSRYPEAEGVLREALAIRLRRLGESHRAIGITANNLAAALYLQNRLDSAVAVQELALRSLRATVGPDHQRSIVALSNVATFKRAAGDLAAAERDYRDLLARQTRLQGPNHPVAARVMVSLGSVLVEHPDSAPRAEGERMIRGAVAAFEASLGPSHPEVGSALERLAFALQVQGRTAEARAPAERAHRLLAAAHGELHRATAVASLRLALVERASGNLAAARRHAERAVAGLAAAAGPRHPETGRAGAAVCDLLVTAGEAAAAAPVCAAAVAALATGPGVYRGSLAQARALHATALIREGRWAAADSALAPLRADSTLPPALRRVVDSLAALAHPPR